MRGKRRLPRRLKAVPTLDDRASGIVLHPTSLPGKSPIGDLGPEAFAFADFLSHSGQRWWQMLPVGPAGPGNSPYQSSSAFAGNPLLVSLEPLVAKGWLPSSVLSVPRGNLDRVDYKAAQMFKEPLLLQAFERFEKNGKPADRRHFSRFCRAERAWLGDFALFCSLLDRYPGQEWNAWDSDLRAHKPGALRRAFREEAAAVRYHSFVQWQFAEQWHALKAYCAQRRVGLLGDLPLFVSHNSADVWAHQEFFQLYRDGRAKVVAGVPPDYFSRTGQRWGNPLYHWNQLRRRRYSWWIRRLRMMFRYFDAVRIDHFIGLSRYYEIPARAKTAMHGRYRKGPGAHFLEEVRRSLGKPALIAEDLGTVTADVIRLRDAFALPGMKVLQFAFGEDAQAECYQPQNYPRRCVVYTGTHDNDTTVGWFSHESEKVKRAVLAYLGSSGREIHWDMIRTALASVGNTAIAPMQDLLGLSSEARMNRPGTTDGNWDWRLRPGAATPDIARRMRGLTETFERL